MRVAGVVLALVGAIGGFFLAFGLWGVGYCGALTPDVPTPGSLRHDLCRGMSGDLMGVLVFGSWIWAAAAPVLGTYLAVRRGSFAPLELLTVLGMIPIATIAVLARVLPQS